MITIIRFVFDAQASRGFEPSFQKTSVREIAGIRKPPGIYFKQEFRVPDRCKIFDLLSSICRNGLSVPLICTVRILLSSPNGYSDACLSAIFEVAAAQLFLVVQRPVLLSVYAHIP